MKRPLCAACLVIVLFTAVRMYLHPPSPISYGEAAGKEVLLTGRVYAKEYQRGYETPVLLIYIEPKELISINQNNQTIPYYNNFICSIKSGEEPPIGCVVTVKGKLVEYETALNPGQFDASAYYAVLGISAQIKDGVLMDQDKGRNEFLEWLWHLRSFLCNCLDIVFIEEDAGLLKTMLLGDKTFLSNETKTLYKEAGIFHILAISGLHISILGMGFYKFLRKLQLSMIQASLISGIVMLVYGIMVGMPVSVKRAVFMFVLRLLSTCIGRTYDMITALMLCAALMLLQQPLYLYHSGFLLSFLAVIAMAVFKPSILPSGIKKVPLADGFFTSLAITIFTLPVQLWFFYEVSVYGVLLNLVVLPLVSSVLILGVVSFPILLLMPVITNFLAIPVHIILIAYKQGCIFIGNLPGSLWMPGKPRAWQILCFLLLILAVILLKKLKWKYKVGLLCGAVLLFGIKIQQGLIVTFLDVGQGDCICLELPDGSTWLVDGGSTSVYDVGTYRIEPFLKSKGIGTLDAVFLSHSDEDHISGILELIENDRIKIELLVLPDSQRNTEEEFAEILLLAKAKAIPLLWLQEGMEWECDGVKAICLHPAADFNTRNTNADSEVLYLTYGNFSLLLTGDVEGEGETALIKNLQERNIKYITLLKVAHHGSQGSTSAEFLAQIDTDIAIISCGKANRYGHPHEKLLTRLLEEGCQICFTRGEGAVVFYTDGRVLKQY